MPKIDNEKFYTSAIELYGATPKGVNWHSASSQKIRFKMIYALLPTPLDHYSLLDAGCGFGDFYTYLTKKKNLPKTYTGVDTHQDMCAIAANTTGCEILQANIIKDPIPTHDFVICSGAMNILKKDETRQFIHNCYSASQYGFIFNILHGKRQSQTYNYLNIPDIKEIAQALNVNKIRFKEGYLDSDITVGFFK